MPRGSDGRWMVLAPHELSMRGVESGANHKIRLEWDQMKASRLRLGWAPSAVSRQSVKKP
eukprot:scaffold25989_cov32-Tisochrysis_lutea.AAC.3